MSGLTGGDSFGCLGSSGVVLDDADGDLVLLARSKPGLDQLVLGGGEDALDFPVFFFLQVDKNEASENTETTFKIKGQSW